MPFRSTAQQRFAFGTRQPWAKRWAKETDFSKLPKRARPKRKKEYLLDQLEAYVSSAHYDPQIAALLALKALAPETTGGRTAPTAKPAAANPARGGKGQPGEKIADGVTRIRGNLCNVHGKYGPCDKALSGKKPKGGKGRAAGGRKPAAPKKTDEQRAAEREQRQAERQQETTRQQALNMTKVGEATGLEDHLANLDQFAQGKPLRDQDIATLEQQGLLERGADGTVRKTEQANVLLNAAKRGDVQGARDAVSRANDQRGKRIDQQTRQEAARQRQTEVATRRQAAAAERAQAQGKKPSKGDEKKPEPLRVRPTKRVARSSAPSGGGVAGAAGNKKPLAEPKPEKEPAKQIAPALTEAATALSEGKQITRDDALALIRNGLARVDRDGMLILTAAGLRTTTKEQTAQDRAMFAKMGGGGSGGSGGSGHAGVGGGGQSTLWPKGPSGKRTPQAAAAETRAHAGARQASLPGTEPEFHAGKRTPAGGEGKGRAADPGKPAHGQTVGNTTKAFGADPNQSYTMRHELVDMGDVHASNTAGGGINPKYDPALQPRDRSRASSQAQIAQVAQNMNPEVLTTDFHRIDAGSPIIDKNGNVLSGNGRTLALQRAAELHPDKYNAYKEQIKAEARAAGIDPAAVDKMQNPVLVRRLQGDHDAAAFAREANSSGTLRMSPLEQAKVDAGMISDRHMLKLNAHETGDIDRALRDKSNKPFVDEFLASVPDNERANLLTRNGELNQMGLYRAKAAIYTRAFPGEAGHRMAESMLESLDPDIKTVQNGINGGLPAFSRATSLARSGLRDPSLDLSHDIAKSVDVYARIKDNPSLTHNTPANQVVAKYLGQSSMFDRELNYDQERILVHIDKISRKPTEVKGFLERYARLVESAPQPGQHNLFGDGGHLTRAQLLDQLLGDAALPEIQTQQGLF